MTNRADKFTQLQKKREYYADFTTSFTRHPVTNALSRVINEDAVAQAIKNIVLTNYGERPYEPDVGSDIIRSLFEQNDYVTSHDVEVRLRLAISQGEPRAVLHGISVEPSPDNYVFKVTIVYSTINTTEPSSLSLIIKRIR